MEILKNFDILLDRWHEIPLAKRAVIIATLLGSAGVSIAPVALMQEPIYLIGTILLYVLGGILDELIKNKREDK